MTHYETVVELAEQLPLAEQARLIEHLSRSLRHNLSTDGERVLSWHEFIDTTAGSLSDDPIERPAAPARSGTC